MVPTEAGNIYLPAAEALENWGGFGNPFEHIDHTFGLFTHKRPSGVRHARH